MTKKKTRSKTNLTPAADSSVPVKKEKLPPHRPREWTEEDIEIERLALERWIADPKNYFFTSFQNERDLHKEHIQRFCEYSPRFRATYARALEIQETRIVEASLTRKFDGNFAKFVLQNKAGWRERSEVSGDAQNPLTLIMEHIAKRKDPEPQEIDVEDIPNE